MKSVIIIFLYYKEWTTVGPKCCYKITGYDEREKVDGLKMTGKIHLKRKGVTAHRRKITEVAKRFNGTFRKAG